MVKGVELLHVSKISMMLLSLDLNSFREPHRSTSDPKKDEGNLEPHTKKVKQISD